MRLLFIGDVIGRAGREILSQQIPFLRQKWDLDFIGVNGENSAGGFGITEKIYDEFRQIGVDCITLGNHAFAQKEALVFIERAPHLLRPLNFPPSTPGRGAYLYPTAKNQTVLVLHAMGRIFMDPILEDPFLAISHELEMCPLGYGCDAILLDMHAEATSEKNSMGHFVDGRVSVMVGTHTHIPTADHRILPHGTAYISDVGMTGDYDSVIGMEKEEPLRRLTTRIAQDRYTPAKGPATLCGIAVETNPKTGLARHISPVRIGGCLAPILPNFW